MKITWLALLGVAMLSACDKPRVVFDDEDLNLLRSRTEFMRVATVDVCSRLSRLRRLESPPDFSPWLTRYYEDNCATETE